MCKQTLRAHRLFVLQGKSINQAACDLAHEVADEGDALTLGGVCQTPSYLSGKGKQVVQEEFRKQIAVFIKNDMDFLLCEVSDCDGFGIPEGSFTRYEFDFRCYYCESVQIWMPHSQSTLVVPHQL